MKEAVPEAAAAQAQELASAFAAWVFQEERGALERLAASLAAGSPETGNPERPHGAKEAGGAVTER
jgi:hypothetical protein